MSVATSDFRDTLMKSGLVSGEQLERFLAQSPVSPDDPAALAAALTEAKLLTPWQRDKLLAGRRKGFFLGKYRILDQLGAGSMGSVFLAEHKLMRHKVALKVISRRLLGKEKYLARFEQEARAAATVNHPRVVRAFDFDTSDDVQYLVMEYVEGEDLQKIVLRDGVLPIPVAAQCIQQTAEGLAAIHEAGLVHRDIKPSNLLIDAAGSVRILDLGLARLADTDSPSLTLMHDAKMIGTVDYLAPEQARNSHRIDHRADLYSLGCTLYFLLCGQPPFNDGTITQRVIEHQSKLPVDIRQRRRDCPSGLAVVCHKLLAKNPAERYPTAQAVIDALTTWLDKHEGRSLPGGSSMSIAAAAPAQPRIRQSSDELSIGELSIQDETQTPGASDTSGSNASASNASGSNASGGSASESLQLADDGDVILPGKSDSSHVGGARRGAASTASPSETPALESLDPLPPLATQDSLADLLDQDILSSDIAAAPLSGTLDSSPLGIGGAADIYRKALAEAQEQKPKSAWATMKSSVIVEEGPEGISYALWFLVASGLLLGIIVCLVGYSYFQSTRPPDVIKDRSSENARRE